jgi:hypothetical protein
MSATTTQNSVQWYEGSQWFQQGNVAHIDDEYQAYRSGACWGVEFQWAEPLFQLANGTAINAAEEAILKTFQF